MFWKKNSVVFICLIELIQFLNGDRFYQIPFPKIPIKIKNSNNLHSCGIQSVKSSLLNLQPRLINGNISGKNSWPWVVPIMYKIGKQLYFVCSGSLISTKFVLTSAKCVKALPKLGILSVSPGSHFLSEAKNPKNQQKVSRIYLHERSHFKENDIALLELVNSVRLSKKIQVVCLPSLKDPRLVYGKKLVLTGWGSNNGKREIEAYSNSLMQTTIRLWNSYNSSLCQRMDLKLYCGMGISSSNACYGDSGSGLVYNFNGRWYLYGISSFGISKKKGNTVVCDSLSPSFFTIIPIHIDWIFSKISGALKPFRTKKISTSTKRIKYAGLI